MAVADLAAVIPLRSHPYDRLIPLTEKEIPEPAQLYCLVGLALVLHEPVPAFLRDQPGERICAQCGSPWPCPSILLAFRLREGF